MQGKVNSINIGKKIGILKEPVMEAKLVENKGIEGDIGSEDAEKQVSLLCWDCLKEKGQVKPGDFSENITTTDIKLPELNIGDKLIIGTDAVLEITMTGKECHKYFEVHYKRGDCDIPLEGAFAKVLKGGIIKAGDPIKKADADEDWGVNR